MDTESKKIQPGVMDSQLPLHNQLQHTMNDLQSSNWHHIRIGDTDGSKSRKQLFSGVPKRSKIRRCELEYMKSSSFTVDTQLTNVSKSLEVIDLNNNVKGAVDYERNDEVDGKTIETESKLVDINKNIDKFSETGSKRVDINKNIDKFSETGSKHVDMNKKIDKLSETGSKLVDINKNIDKFSETGSKHVYMNKNIDKFSETGSKLVDMNKNIHKPSETGSKVVDKNRNIDKLTKTGSKLVDMNRNIDKLSETGSKLVDINKNIDMRNAKETKICIKTEYSKSECKSFVNLNDDNDTVDARERKVVIKSKTGSVINSNNNIDAIQETHGIFKTEVDPDIGEVSGSNNNKVVAGGLRKQVDKGCGKRHKGFGVIVDLDSKHENLQLVKTEDHAVDVEIFKTNSGVHLKQFEESIYCSLCKRRVAKPVLSMHIQGFKHQQLKQEAEKVKEGSSVDACLIQKDLREILTKQKKHQTLKTFHQDLKWARGLTDEVSTPTATSPVSTSKATTPVSTSTATSPVSASTAKSHVSASTDSSTVSTPTASSPVSMLTATSHVSVPTATSPVCASTATSPVFMPTATSHVSPPKATSPVSTASSSVFTPTATSHVSPPKATSPVFTPKATSPVSTPTATSPVSTPKATSLASVPTATSHVSAPTATSPVSMPTATSPVSKLIATSPVSMPTATSPVFMPTATSPVFMPTATSPVFMPTATSPVSKPTATSPVFMPTATSHVFMPTATSPVSKPTATSPVSKPTASSPVFMPTATSPVSKPTATSPVFMPTATSPVFMPTATSPVSKPTATLPVFMPTATSPVFMPTATSPVSKPTATSPVFMPTATSPVFMPTATSPVFMPTATSPVFMPTATSPVSKPTATSPVFMPTATSHVFMPTATSPVSKPTAKSPVSKPTATSPVFMPTATSPVFMPTATSLVSTPTATSPVHTSTALAADTSDSGEFKLPVFIESISSLKKLDGEAKLKSKQLEALRIDATNIEAIMEDPSHDKECYHQFEESCAKIEDYILVLEQGITQQRSVIDMCNAAEDFYYSQFDKTKAAANVYKNFGDQVTDMKKRVDDMKKAFPNMPSPVQSQADEVSSLGNTPLLLNIDDNETIYMETDMNDLDKGLAMDFSDLDDDRDPDYKPESDSEADSESKSDSPEFDNANYNIIHESEAMDFSDLDDDRDPDYTPESDSEADSESKSDSPQFYSADYNIIQESEEENSNMSVTWPALKQLDFTEQQQKQAHNDESGYEVIRDINIPSIYCRKIIKSDTFNNKKKKNDRTQNTRHACKFCGKLVGHVQDHMIRNHRDKREVKDIELCIEEKMKNKKKDILRIEGDHLHNKKVVEEKRGEMILSRRPDDIFDHSNYGPCVSCKLWLLKNSLVKHMKTCCGDKKTVIRKKRYLQTMSEAAIDTTSHSGDKKLLIKEVFTIITRDEVGVVAMNDQLICKLGEFWLKNCVDNKKKRAYWASQHMRLMARLLICVRNMHNKISLSMWDILRPSFYESLVQGALESSLQDMDDVEELKSPTNVIKLNYDLMRICGYKSSISNQKFDTTGDILWKKQKKQAEGALLEITRSWKTKCTKLARKNLLDRKLNKKEQLPNPEDIRKLGEYLTTKLKELNVESLIPHDVSYQDYKDMVELVQARLLTYNKRRTGEIEDVTVQNYMRKLSINDIDQGLIGEVSDTDRYLIQTHDLIQTRGKRGSIVPVLIPVECKGVMDVLADTELRQKLDIKTSYLFASNTNGNPIRAYDSLNKMCDMAGLSRPQDITSTKMRKYMVTLAQVMNLSADEMQQMCRHLGHTTRVHLAHYRTMSPYIERVTLGKILLMQDLNVQSQFHGQSLKDIDFVDIIHENSENKDDLVASSSHKEDEPEPMMYEAMAIEDGSQETKKRGKKVTKQKWTDGEITEIKKYFSKQLEKKQAPRQKDCIKAKAASRADGGELHKRAWHLIVKKVSAMNHKK